MNLLGPINAIEIVQVKNINVSREPRAFLGERRQAIGLIIFKQHLGNNHYLIRTRHTTVSGRYRYRDQELNGDVQLYILYDLPPPRPISRPRTPNRSEPKRRRM